MNVKQTKTVKKVTHVSIINVLINVTWYHVNITKFVNKENVYKNVKKIKIVKKDINVLMVFVLINVLMSNVKIKKFVMKAIVFNVLKIMIVKKDKNVKKINVLIKENNHNDIFIVCFFYIVIYKLYIKINESFVILVFYWKDKFNIQLIII